ncbi:MAG: adenylate kinase [Dehalococcoidales bacterium]|nr:adenylate kinase [Dehalococcoidales bacterium]
MKIILLGAPGAGKGTQAGLISQKLNLAHIATGDLVRQAIEIGTELGRTAKSYMEKGQLVPDEITVRMVMDRITADDCKNGIVLDGFPRNLQQARALDQALETQKNGIDAVIYIKVSEEELLKRLGGRWICRRCQTPYHEIYSPPKVAGICDKCGGELYQRPDDNINTIKKRLEVYFNETAPLVDYYKQKGKLIEVDGEGSMEEINERIVSVLQPLNKKR